MTAEELKQYRNIKNEIALRKTELNELILKSKNVDSMGIRSSTTSDIVADIVQERDRIKAIINKLESRVQAIEQYIDGCDSYIGEMLEQHYIKGKTWTAIALKNGGNNKGNSLRMMCHRYIKKNP